MRPSRLARYLVPIALIATGVGVYMIVHHGLKAIDTKTTTVTTSQATPKGKYRHARFYVVQPGDTLTQISQKTGVPIATLEALNPNIDPNSLQTGQRLRLRR